MPMQGCSASNVLMEEDGPYGLSQRSIFKTSGLVTSGLDMRNMSDWSTFPRSYKNHLRHLCLNLSASASYHTWEAQKPKGTLSGSVIIITKAESRELQQSTQAPAARPLTRSNWELTCSAPKLYLKCFGLNMTAYPAAIKLGRDFPVKLSVMHWQTTFIIQ